MRWRERAVRPRSHHHKALYEGRQQAGALLCHGDLWIAGNLRGKQRTVWRLDQAGRSAWHVRPQQLTSVSMQSERKPAGRAPQNLRTAAPWLAASPGYSRPALRQHSSRRPSAQRPPAAHAFAFIAPLPGMPGRPGRTASPQALPWALQRLPRARQSAEVPGETLMQRLRLLATQLRGGVLAVLLCRLTTCDGPPMDLQFAKMLSGKDHQGQLTKLADRNFVFTNHAGQSPSI